MQPTTVYGCINLTRRNIWGDNKTHWCLTRFVQNKKIICYILCFFSQKCTRILLCMWKTTIWYKAIVTCSLTYLLSLSNDSEFDLNCAQRDIWLLDQSCVTQAASTATYQPNACFQDVNNVSDMTKHPLMLNTEQQQQQQQRVQGWINKHQHQVKTVIGWSRRVKAQIDLIRTPSHCQHGALCLYLQDEEQLLSSAGELYLLSWLLLGTFYYTSVRILLLMCLIWYFLTLWFAFNEYLSLRETENLMFQTIFKHMN